MHRSMNIKFIVINISAEGKISMCAEVPIMIMNLFVRFSWIVWHNWLGMPWMAQHMYRCVFRFHHNFRAVLWDHNKLKLLRQCVPGLQSLWHHVHVSSILYITIYIRFGYILMLQFYTVVHGKTKNNILNFKSTRVLCCSSACNCSKGHFCQQ
jgi:hypothetical protein